MNVLITGAGGFIGSFLVDSISSDSKYNVVTSKNTKFPIHDDTPNKLLSGVIYLTPEENSGTIFYSSKKGENKKEIEWKQNRAVFFSRKEKKNLAFLWGKW